MHMRVIMYSKMLYSNLTLLSPSLIHYLSLPRKYCVLVHVDKLISLKNPHIVILTKPIH